MRSNVTGSAAWYRRPRARSRDAAFGRGARAPAPPRSPIFRSRLQGELLARLLLGPRREVSMLDLAVMLRSDLGSVMREAERMSQAGVLSLRRTLAGRLVSRDEESPLYEALARLVMLTFGPAAVVAEEFGSLPSVRELHLFGAWAGRYNGVGGDQAVDVEVLVVGAVRREVAFDAAQDAAARLGLPVHPVVRGPAEWADDSDPFLREIRAGQLFDVTGFRGGAGSEVVR